ncbi:MAG: hypothetical protein WC208_15030 [Gallionella sp.]|jgi:hypothetical protein
MGSGGGSGGTSGTVDYPAYMKTVHGQLLDNNGADTPSSSVVDCINTQLAASTPYSGVTAYDPDTVITAMDTAVTNMTAIATALAYHTDFDNMAAAAKAEIDVVAPSTNLDTAISSLVTLVGNLSKITDFNAIADAASTEIDTIHPRTAYTTAVGLAQVLVTAMTYHTDYDAMVAAAVDEIDTVFLPASKITSLASAFATDLDTAIDTATYARFQSGMRDVGAAMTSAFTIGAANIEAEKTRQVSKFTSELNYKSYGDRKELIATGVQQMLTMYIGKIEKQHGIALAEIENLKDRATLLAGAIDEMVKMLLEKTKLQAVTAEVEMKAQASKQQEIGQAIQIMSAMLTNKLEYTRVANAVAVEVGRLTIIAKDEEEKRNTEIDVRDALWDLELFQYGSNVLASISGGTAVNRTEGRSPITSAMSGALSGAVAGAMIAGASEGAIAGPMGAGVGALIGLGAGLFS